MCFNDIIILNIFFFFTLIFYFVYIRNRYTVQCDVFMTNDGFFLLFVLIAFTELF